MTSRFSVASILLTFLFLRPAAPFAAEATAPGWPRVALLPFVAPADLEVLGQTLQGNLHRSLKGRLQVVRVDPMLLQGTAESCIMQPACVDRVLAETKAEALLGVVLEAHPSDRTREPRVLLSVTAPGWPIAYVERRASPDEGQVDETARTLLMLARGQALPERLSAMDAELLADDGGEEEDGAARPKTDRKSTRVARKAAKEAQAKEEAARKAAEELARLQLEAEEARRAAELASRELAGGEPEGDEAAGDSPDRAGEAVAPSRGEQGSSQVAGLEDDALAEDEPTEKERAAERKRRQKALEAGEARREKERQARLEAREADERRRQKEAREAEEAKRRAERQAARQASKPVWPARAPAGPWHGWSIELQAGGAYGALRMSANSQVATSTMGEVVDRYRWAVLENAPGYSGHLGVGLNLFRYLEAGVDFGVMPASRVVLLSFFPEDLPSYKGEDRGFDLQLQLAPRLRFFPLPGRTVQPYAGLAASMRWVPGVESFPAEAGPHEPLGPYQRLGIEPAMGVRVLLKQRLFLSFEGRMLLEPGAAYLESDLDRSDGSVIPVPELVTPANGGRALGTLRVGLGLLL